ncbi:MAG: hypothetical protein JSR94_06865 [Proteobacteria bacterium]|nr:hypothetical protein [Pseudomonadota bacterium]
MHELHDISDLDPDGLPSKRTLLRATATGAGLAALLLVFAVLPAEFGIDPTGLGRRLGLTALHAAGSTAPAPVASTPAPAPDTRAPVHRLPGELRSDTLTVPLAPHRGAEIKAIMSAGQSFVFHWQAEGGPVHVDMHGDLPDAKADEFTSYWLDDALAAAGGSFTAPFTGRHGWYWENRSDRPVTIRLQVSGFYERLYMP